MATEPPSDSRWRVSPRTIGRLRRMLMIRGTHRWNAWVRTVTGWLG